MTRSFPHRPLLIRVLNALGLVTTNEGLRKQPLDSDALNDRARSRTDREELRPGDFIDPFRLVVQRYNTEPGAHPHNEQMSPCPHSRIRILKPMSQYDWGHRSKRILAG